jgi:Ca2+-binding RTX toxin-like protein
MAITRRDSERSVPAGRPPRLGGAALERLEQRRLMSVAVATQAGGVEPYLAVTGTGGDDLITLFPDGRTPTSVTVTINGETFLHDLAGLTKINVTGNDGDDTLVLHDPAGLIALPVSLWGVWGNDILIGGGGADVLMGGPGDDLLVGEGGDDNLGGGEGADRLLGGAGSDDLSGGLGADNVDGGEGIDKIYRGVGGDEDTFAPTDPEATLPTVTPDGVLWIHGTDGDDLIQTWYDPADPAVLVVAVNGMRTQVAGSFRSAMLDVGGGTDRWVSYMKGKPAFFSASMVGGWGPEDEYVHDWQTDPPPLAPAPPAPAPDPQPVPDPVPEPSPLPPVTPPDAPGPKPRPKPKPDRRPHAARVAGWFRPLVVRNFRLRSTR